MSSLKALLYRNQAVKLTANHAYVYGIQLIHLVLDLLPWFLRGPGFRLLGLKAGRRVFLDHRLYLKFPWLVRMGDGVSVNRGVEFYPDFHGGHRIVLGRNVRVAPHVRFHAAAHDLADTTYAHTGGDIVVEDDVWIGAGALLLPGVTVGAGSVIGAGSVVTRDVPPGAVAAGVPARVVRERDPAP
jgi:maltose O-acetyltransferase